MPRHILHLVTACAAALLLLSGCTVGSPGTRGDRDQAGELSTELVQRLNSYTIDSSQSSDIDGHLFGITGAASLSTAVEKHALDALRSAGAFHGHRAFDPTVTKPDQRWKPEEFIESRDDNQTPRTADRTADEQKASADGEKAQSPVTVFNSVIAAGGDMLISRLTTDIGGKQDQRVFVTDLDKDETKPAAALFADAPSRGLGMLTINSRALPVVGNTPAKVEELSTLGKRAHEALREKLTLPSDEKSYLPDYSCELIPCVALTYDDGPADDDMTTELSQHLIDADLRATFYQIGRNVRSHPKASRALHDQGNEIGSHSWSHPDLGESSPAKVRRELGSTDKALDDTGVPTTTELRPPYGATSPKTDEIVDKRIIQWDIDTRDWKTHNASTTVERGSKAQPGSIILMHSIRPSTIKAAPQLFDELKAKGLYPVPVSYLFQGLPFESHGEYFCRGYHSPLCSNPEHPMVKKGAAMAKPAPRTE